MPANGLEAVDTRGTARCNAWIILQRRGCFGSSLRPIFSHNAAPLRRRARIAVSLPPPMDSGLALRTPVSTCSIQSGGATSKRGRYLTRREGSAHNRVGRVRASNGPPRTGSCKLNRKSASFLPRRSPGSSPGQEASFAALAMHRDGQSQISSPGSRRFLSEALIVGHI